MADFKTVSPSAFEGRNQRMEQTSGFINSVLGTLLSEGIKRNQSERARTGLENMLNPPQEMTTSTPEEVEQHTAEQAMKTQIPEMPDTLSDMLQLPKSGDNTAQTQQSSQLGQETPAPSPNLLTPQATQKPITPLQTPATAQMPPAQTAMIKPQPGSPGYTSVPSGQSPEVYGQVASAHMAPKTLEQILAQKVDSGEITPEEAFQMKNQYNMTTGKLSSTSINDW